MAMQSSQNPLFLFFLPTSKALFLRARLTGQPFVGCPQGAGLAEPWEKRFFLGKILSFVSFFLQLRPKAARIRPLNESMGRPISWGNGIIRPHVYLAEPISEALHF